jgi:hypothetical protein
MGGESEAIQKLTSAIYKWYWSRKNDLSRDDAIKPALDVLEYIYKARKEGLDKRSEAAYCGSILLYSVLSLTGRRHTSEVDEANELYEVGKNLASFIWDELDEMRNDDKDPDGLDPTYSELLSRISDTIWKKYKTLKEGSNE